MKKKLGLSIFIVTILALCLSVFVGCNKKKDNTKIQKLPEQKVEKTTDKEGEVINKSLSMLDTKKFSTQQLNNMYTNYFDDYEFYKSENFNNGTPIKHVYDKKNNRMYVGTYDKDTEKYVWKFTKKDSEINKIKDASEPDLIDYKSLFAKLTKVGAKEKNNYVLDKDTNELKYNLYDDLNPGNDASTFYTKNTNENSKVYGVIDSIIIKDGEVKIKYHENAYKDKDGNWIMENTDEKTVVLKNTEIKSEIPEEAEEF